MAKTGHEFTLGKSLPANVKVKNGTAYFLIRNMKNSDTDRYLFKQELYEAK
ncbi:MAG: hypothetical protein ABEH43_01245 [Flavobacteriales bacterium]